LLGAIKILKPDTGPGTTMAENAKRLFQKYYVLMNSLIKAEPYSRKQRILFINICLSNPVLHQLKVLSAL